MPDNDNRDELDARLEEAVANRKRDQYVEELEASIRTLLEENARLVKAINDMPEWERAVKAATSEEIAALRNGLREALTMWADEVGVKEHGTDDNYDRLCKLAETGVMFPVG